MQYRWIGEAGPAALYGEDGTGLDDDFTNRNTTFITWNLLHLARMLKDAGGAPPAANESPTCQRRRDGGRTVDG